MDCLAETGWNGFVPLVAGALVFTLGAATVTVIRRRGRVHRNSVLTIVLIMAMGLLLVTTGSSEPASAAGAHCVNPGAQTSPTTATSASPTPTPVIGGDEQVSFVSGGVTFYGSYRGPVDVSSAVPAAVIVVGTGDVDRNGNTPTINTEAYSWLADLLAAQGIASLRYDKLGAGETGLGPYTGDPARMLPLSYDQLRAQPARDALSLLAAQPGVDSNRILLLGHSEGGAVAIDIAAHPGSTPPLAGLLLVEPSYTAILDILARQFAQTLDEGVAAGAVTATDEQTLEQWVDAGIRQIRNGDAPYPTPGPVPLPEATGVTQSIQNAILSNIYGSDPTQMVISHAYRTAYGKDFDTVVPHDLAPLVGVPTLVTCGTKDFNTPCGDGTTGSGVAYLASRFAPGVAQFDVIPDMVHILRDTGTDDVTDVTQQLNYPFSTELADRFSAHLARFTQP